MILDLTPAQLRSQPEIIDVLFSKLMKKTEWKTSELTRSQIQFCFDNDITMDRAELYSPVLTDVQINADVPLSWPDSQVLDVDGLPIKGRTFAEYLRPTEVIGGTVLQFVGRKMDVNRNITLPSWPQLKAQVEIAGGFMMKSEVDAIRIEPIGEEL
jgi:hypothetical protein